MPAPCCCLTPEILSQGPDVVKTLLRKLDFQPMTDMVSSMADTLVNLDVDKVKGLLEKFATSASDSVGKLDVVKAANMASNPMGAVGGKFGFGARSAAKRNQRIEATWPLFRVNMYLSAGVAQCSEGVLATASTERPILMRVERGGVRGREGGVGHSTHVRTPSRHILVSLALCAVSVFLVC